MGSDPQAAEVTRRVDGVRAKNEGRRESKGEGNPFAELGRGTLLSESWLCYGLLVAMVALAGTRQAEQPGRTSQPTPAASGSPRPYETRQRRDRTGP